MTSNKIQTKSKNTTEDIAVMTDNINTITKGGKKVATSSSGTNTSASLMMWSMAKSSIPAKRQHDAMRVNSAKSIKVTTQTHTAFTLLGARRKVFTTSKVNPVTSSSSTSLGVRRKAPTTSKIVPVTSSSSSSSSGLVHPRPKIFSDSISMPVMMTSTTSYEEQLMIMASTIERLQHSLKEQDLKIASLTEKLKLHDDNTESSKG
ncbi:cell wall integrity and stress response component 2-like [Cornus florida]|uniref:cell wall integrity and stress response component 2-like n=1 Tax=Cornus florida TaxID=4283 RepID=UPI0028973DEC|nr:cell wall integrity and stress response component 2-like [Cornus florida]